MLMRLLSRRWVQIFLLLSLLAGIVYLRTLDPPVVHNLRQLTFDAYNRTFPREAFDDTLIVDIDEASLARYGQWPWPRTQIAEIVAELNALGAKAIVFDIAFAEPDRTSPAQIAGRLPVTPELEAARQALAALPDNDALLAEKIREAGNVVMGFVGASQETSHVPPVSPNFCHSALPENDPAHPFNFAFPQLYFATSLPALSAAAAGNGIFSAQPDNDGIIRTVSVVAGQADKDNKTLRLMPSLALEGLRVALGTDKVLCYEVKTEPPGNGDKGGIRSVNIDMRVVLEMKYDEALGRERMTPRPFRPGEDETGKGFRSDTIYEIPVNADGKIQVYYANKQRGQLYIPAWQVLEKKADPARVKDKIVFIGTSSIGLLDLRSSPLNPTLPGVEIHAEIVEQVLHHQFLSRPLDMDGKELLPTVAICVIIILVTPFMGVGLLAVMIMMLVAGGITGSMLLYKQGLLVDPVYPSITVMFIFIFSSILSNLRSEMEKRMIRQAFDRYLSPALIEELVKNPDKLKLGGEVRELTVMFTDIRNFTTISESMDPAELIRMMNDFLTPMTSAVLDNKGFVDKYMGDAMMTFWNAPVDTPDHAEAACRAALEMMEALKPVNAELKARAEAAGRTFYELKAGIGINSGRASVGNMGSKQRFAYSALGDTVNLASRLEGQTKAYGISAMISNETRRQAPGFAAIEIDLLTVKGRTEPERVFALLGKPEEAQGEAFRTFAAKHESMLGTYRAMKWDEAKALADECAQLRPDLALLYGLYKNRIAAYLQNPPPAGWNGVYVAKDK